MPKIDLNPMQAGGKVDPVSDPTGTVMKFIVLVAGFALFLTAFAFGQDAASKLQQQIASLTGIESQNGNGTQIKVA